jgi:hypothetical protein
MKNRLPLLTVFAVALASLVTAGTAAADPSHDTFPPFPVHCTSGDSFLISTGDFHNRSTQGFVVNDTSILVVRTLSVDGTLAFSRAAGGATRNYTTCTGTDTIGEEFVIAGFVTPRS